MVRFKAHLADKAGKATKVALALRRLKGLQPKTARQLAKSAVLPVADYGSPIWFPLVTHELMQLLQQAQRIAAQAVIRGFQTVTLSIAEVEAGLIPLPEAMVIVLNIIHGRASQVPRVVDLDMLTKLAVIVDYLECHEVVELFSDRWVDNMKGKMPSTYSNELIQWLCVTFILLHHKVGYRLVITPKICLRDGISALEHMFIRNPGKLRLIYQSEESDAVGGVE